MRFIGVNDPKTDRVKEIKMLAEDFQDERFLSAVRSGVNQESCKMACFNGRDWLVWSLKKDHDNSDTLEGE